MILVVSYHSNHTKQKNETYKTFLNGVLNFFKKKRRKSNRNLTAKRIFNQSSRY